MDIKFNDSKNFTIGVELELQLVDTSSFALAHTSSDILNTLTAYKDSIKHELMMSNIEVISSVCQDVAQVEADLKKKLAALMKAAALHDTFISSASTHPFSSWKDQTITDDPRYNRLKDILQILAWRFNIFGLHVHVGVDGAEKAIYVFNRLIYYLPHLLAVSANSPFWEAMNTGFKSYRSMVFGSLPHGGLPFYFKDWADYKKLVGNFLATGTIETIRELWWDVRPHPDFGTVEVRVCDIPSTLKEVLAITALVQAIVKSLSDDYDRGVEFTKPHPSVTRENKWRAARWGLDGKFLTKDSASTIGIKEAISGIVKAVTPDADELGSCKYLMGIDDILKDGTGAARQLELWKGGSLEGVVKGLVERLAGEAAE